MAQHNNIGQLGEQLAQRHLEEKGFAILETNWRNGRHEIDIIAYKEGMIVFAEVKTRSNLDYGNPEDFVTRNKQKSYIRLANNYVINHHRNEEVRFDIISVNLSGTSYHIVHIEDAFSAIG